MAVASTAKDFSTLNESKDPLFHSNGKDEKSQLNFYESIYNFKKMFPNLDYEVIETVLRSNNGNIDKSIDQLLTMSTDAEVIEAATAADKTTRSSVQNSTFAASAHMPQNLNDSTDQPPSYSELVSMNLIENNTTPTENLSANLSNNDSYSIKKSDNKSSSQRQSELISRTDFADTHQPKTIHNSKQATQREEVTIKSSAKYINNFNKILIGDLSKDFLRIKLNNDQVKKLKTNIKKAKRNEIVALLNNVRVLYKNNVS
jgi:hypothetical protein